MVGTVKKSTATKSLTWLFRKVRHVCEGGFLGRAIYLATVACERLMPSLSSSPWILGAPQRGPRSSYGSDPEPPGECPTSQDERVCFSSSNRGGPLFDANGRPP